MPLMHIFYKFAKHTPSLSGTPDISKAAGTIACVASSSHSTVAWLAMDVAKSCKEKNKFSDI